MSEIAELMRSANPVPDPDSAISDQQFDALLLLTRARSTDVEVKEVLAPMEPKKPGRRGWGVAAVAFAVVIAVVSVAVLLAPAREETPPVTSPPTTQAAPPTSAAEEPFVEPEAELTDELRSLVDAYEAAFNSGDVDRYIAMYASTVQREASGLGAIWTSSLEDEVRFYEFAQEMGTSLELIECEPRDGGLASCRALRRDDLTRAAGIEPAWSILSLGFDDGQVTTWREAMVGYAFYEIALEEFASWLDEAHPEAGGAVVVSTAVTDWIMTAENGRLAHRYLLEWESLNAGVSPEQLADVGAFVDVFNGGDVDVYMDQYASDGVIREFGPAGPGDISAERARTQYAWMAGVGTTIGDVTCTPKDEGVRCVGALSDALHDAIGTSWPITFELEISDGAVKRFETVSTPYWATVTAFAPFLDWITTNHPDDEAAMFAASTEPRFTAESAELWILRTAEYGRAIDSR